MVFESIEKCVDTIRALQNKDLLLILKKWQKEDNAEIENLENGFDVEPNVSYDEDGLVDFIFDHSEDEDICSILEDTYENCVSYMYEDEEETDYDYEE